MKKWSPHLAVAVAFLAVDPGVLAGDAKTELREFVDKLNQTAAGGTAAGEAGSAPGAKLVVATGKPLPDFQEKDLEGKPLSLASHKGKFLLIDFWQTSNGTRTGVQNELKLYDRFHTHGFDIIGISLDTGKDQLTKYLAEQKIPWPQYFDGLGWQNKVAVQYGIKRVPASYLLDPEGNVIASDLSAPEIDTKLQAALNSLDRLVANSRLWSLSPEEFERLPATAGFRWNSSTRDSARAGEQALSLAKLPVVEAVARFDQGKLVRLDAAFYTRGDSRGVPPPDLIRSAERALTQISGDAKPRPLEDAASTVKASREAWYGRAAKFVLESSSSQAGLEFVRLVLTPPAPWDIGFKPLRNENDKSFNGFFHVKRNVPMAGDVLIPDVPMVDQGQKGYCAVACAERVFRYFGRGADANEIAQLANSDPETGTNGNAMFRAIEGLGGRLMVKVSPVERVKFDQLVVLYNRAAPANHVAPVSFVPKEMPVPGRPGMVMRVYDVNALFASMDVKTLREALAASVGEKEFRAGIIKYIELGIPLIWSVRLGLFPEPNVPQAGGGHMRLIIGYNSRTKEVLYTDSWGKGHELKRMPLVNAMAMTLALDVIEPAQNPPGTRK